MLLSLLFITALVCKIYAQANIIRIEYFIDTDPGIGNAVSLNITPATNIQDAVIPVNPTGLSTGIHHLYVRAQDANGKWSLTNTFLFYKPYPIETAAQPGNIIRIEYFIDTDPGIGNAAIIAITPAANIQDAVIPVNAPALSTGMHRLYVRAQDADGKWTLTNTYLFFKPAPVNPATTPANIDLLEYYIDKDPGFGAATKITFTPGTDLSDLIIPVNTDRISPCDHVLYVRARDSLGKWSMVNNYSFVNESTSITAAPQDFMVQLDGVNDYLDLGNWFKVPAFTVSFWIKPDAVQTAGAAVVALQNDLYLYSNPNAQDNYVLSHGLQFDMLPGKWNHIAITVDSATQTRKVYLFGQLIDENQRPYNPENGFNVRFGNGGFFPAAYFKGQIDEVRLWNSVLSPDEVYQNIHTKLTGNENGLLGYWNFNNGCASVAVDVSQNGHAANLINGVAKLPSTVPEVGQQIIPNKAGTGWVTVKIYDNLFKQGAVTKLTRNNTPDIFADTTVINQDGTIATVTFNLAGKDTGIYNIIVLNTDTTEKKYNNSFTIEEIDTSGTISIQMLGKNVYRPGKIHKFLIVYQNTGNIDVESPGFSLHSYGKDFMAFSSADLIYKWQILPLLFGNRVSNGDYNEFSNSDTVLSPGNIYTIPIYVYNELDNGTRLSSHKPNLTPCEELSNFTAANHYPNRPDFNGGNGGASLPYGEDDVNKTKGHNYIDGCSVPENLVAIINNILNYYENWSTLFLPACAVHDLCYQTCYKKNESSIVVGEDDVNWRAKSICDVEMYRRMNEICDSYSGDQGKCRSAATLFYKGLVYAGGHAFIEDQSFCTDGDDEPPVPNSSPNYYAPDCEGCKQGTICFKQNKIGSYDPNEKIGPAKFQNAGSYFNYLISFENKATATAPAQEVTIIDTLDKTKFDISTFRFGLFGFGDTLGQVTNQYNKSFSTNIDLRPAKNLIVKVEGRVDTTVGIVYWKFMSLDTTTLLLTDDPEEGFLPPADSISNRGEGWVSYNIKPFPYLESGTLIENRATIIFDNNAPIITNTHGNVIDKVPPVSNVKPLRSVQADSNFVVQWTGRDSIISGIKNWDIYVSDNLSSYQYWKTNTSDSFDVFPGHAGHEYRFYSIAKDSADNTEPGKLNYEAITFVSLSIPDSICVGDNGKIIATTHIPGNTYRWQVNTGTGYVDVANNTIYDNNNRDTLTLTTPPSSFSGYLFRCIITNGASTDTTKVHELFFTNLWTGTVSDEWENAANWDCNLIPDANTDVIIKKDAVRFPVVRSSNAICKSVKAPAGAAVNVQTGFTLTVTGNKQY